MTSICTTVGMLSVTAGALSLPTFLYLHEHRQLVDDWTTLPFVDVRLEVSQEGNGQLQCGEGYEPVFGRVWNGTYEVCQTGNARLGNYDIKRLFAKDDCDGDIFDEIPPINMTSEQNALVCGKRGGKNFLETQRVDPVTYECPQNFVPCSDLTPPSETVCVESSKKDEECPILDIMFIKQDQIEQKENEGYV